MTTKFKISMMLAALCLAAMPVLAQQDSSSQSTGDPLADAARKARAKKKDEVKPKKVFTDDDVKPAAAIPAPPPGNTGTTTDGKMTPAGGKTGGKNGEAATDQNGETAWRKRFKEQRDNIGKVELELDVLQRESQKQQVEYYPDPQKAMIQQNTRKDINETNAKIEEKKQAIAKLKQGLEDLTDALRKAGGDPGWGN